MAAAVDQGKAFITTAKEFFARLRQRWPWLDHLILMQDRYTVRRGNQHAASIAFTGILALVPIIMVAFAIGGFVLASQPTLIDEIKEAVVKQLPGSLGTQVSGVIDSAIRSRSTVGLLGLFGAAFTGIGWMSGVRLGMTEMFGGRVKRNAVMSKLTDLATFVVLGLAFVVTLGLSTLANGGKIVKELLDLVGLADASWVPPLLRGVAIAISVLAGWVLFTLMLTRLPLVPLPFRNAAKAGLVTAIAFEMVKSLGGIYLKTVLSSPAGVAFGPLIGVMVFAYLAARIILYATAWCATAPSNERFTIVDELEEAPAPPVVVRPTVEVNPMPRAGAVAAAVATGAAVGAAAARLRRR
ncbi:MAG: YhjD/YihY/BrkB family envelope integrity protein [Gordonia sp. (in: high G+C Gram-positive bacteria)]